MLNLLRDIFIPTQTVKESPLPIESLDHFLHHAGLESAETIRLDQLPLDEGVPILSPQKILSAYVPDLIDIYHHTAITPQDFNDLYYQVLLRFTEYVHLTPASKNYHHSEIGGLLVHSLQVAKHAMAYLKEHESHLSTYLPADKRSTQRHHWHYLTFLAGLYHDSGKPLTDMYIHDTQGRVWNAYATPLYRWLKHNHIEHYYVHYYHKRSLKEHLRASHHVFHQTMTDAARFFFSTSNRELLLWFNEILTGNARSDLNFLARCLEHGDMASTRLAFQQGKSRFLLSGNLQWHTLVKEELYLIFTDANANHPDAHVWVANDSVYLTVPGFFQYLSEQLIRKNIHHVPLDHEILIRDLNDMGMLTMPSEIAQHNPVFSATFQVAGKSFDRYVVMLSPVMIHDLSFYLIQQCRISYQITSNLSHETTTNLDPSHTQIQSSTDEDERTIIEAPDIIHDSEDLTPPLETTQENTDEAPEDLGDTDHQMDLYQDASAPSSSKNDQKTRQKKHKTKQTKSQSNTKKPSTKKKSNKVRPEPKSETNPPSLDADVHELLKTIANGISIPRRHVINKDYLKIPWPSSAEGCSQSLKEILGQLDANGCLYKDHKNPYQFVFMDKDCKHIRIKYEYRELFNIQNKLPSSNTESIKSDNEIIKQENKPPEDESEKDQEHKYAIIRKRFQKLVLENQHELNNPETYTLVEDRRVYPLKTCIEWYRNRYPDETYFSIKLALSTLKEPNTDYIFLDDSYV